MFITVLKESDNVNTKIKNKTNKFKEMFKQ